MHRPLRKVIAQSAVGRRVRPIYVQISQRLRLARNVLYDARRFLRWSFTVRRPLNRDQLRASLVMTYHSVEKGLALPNPRPAFGQDKVDHLIALMHDYSERFGSDDYLATSLNVLQTYHAFNCDHGSPYAPAERALTHFRSAHPSTQSIETGGVRRITRDDIAKATTVDFERFCGMRYSVRHFSSKPVSRQMIERAVRIAQKTPSVCNRQSCRVHVFTKQELKTAVLAHQNGNRGFGHQAAAVLIVTSDLQHFHNPGERFQCWIDGGMFSMSLLYAIHALRLGACALNWSATCDRDRALRRAVGIPDNEIVIMMIALGHVPAEFDVPQSTRKHLDEVFRWHDDY